MESVTLKYMGRSILVTAPVSDQKLAMLIVEEQVRLIVAEARRLWPNLEIQPPAQTEWGMEMSASARFLCAYYRYADADFLRLLSHALQTMSGAAEDARLALSAVLPVVLTGYTAVPGRRSEEEAANATKLVRLEGPVDVNVLRQPNRRKISSFNCDENGNITGATQLETDAQGDG